MGVPKPSKGSERLAKENEELQLAFLDRQQVLEQKTRRRQEQKRVRPTSHPHTSVKHSRLGEQYHWKHVPVFIHAVS